MNDNAVQIRKRIHEYVDKADDRFLNLVNSMIDADEQTIVGYRPDGTPISGNNLRNSVAISEQQIEGGEVISKQEFLKEFEAWKKKTKTSMK